ncbi:hypothetical protein RUM43_000384 [Polyplax serrata]|uniref:Uncharacterized protein n=1 Tax=Polyplax serrata TaxID=468196 RepID=A0AAN8SCQ7_POLSC
MGEYLPKMGSSTFRKFSHTTIPTAFAEMKPQPVRTPFQEPEPTPTFNDEPGSKPNKSSSTRLHQGPVLSSNSIVKPKQQSPFKLTMPTLGNKEVVGNKAKQPPLQISIPRLDSKETVVNKPKQPTMQMLYKPPTHFRSGPAKQQSPVSPPARQPVRPPVGTPPQGINNVNNIVSNPPGKLEEESSIYGDPSQENTSLGEYLRMIRGDILVPTLSKTHS